MDRININEIVDINLSSEDEEIQIRVPKRYIRDGENPFEFYNEWEFKKRFRFAKNSIMFSILPLIEEGLSKVNNRGLPIAPVFQLLISLRFYATANFQAVVGPRTEFLDIVPEWPGSEHDSRIFQNSRIYMRYRQRELDGILVGDSGYPSLPFLLTPINNPTSDKEERFDIHII
ncbi:Putative nuclease HARBI1 [Trachymyrmex cornetzi]|uniref:Putative nuclease HARBI1 n=1 Tax=Trachymyrmex cornetzi TaxID=471704 RepID=A0A151J6Q6_9HYME|nr:Putative nuclease HARBI1 [Trachymyrmex cornetzi]